MKSSLFRETKRIQVLNVPLWMPSCTTLEGWNKYYRNSHAFFFHSVSHRRAASPTQFLNLYMFNFCYLNFSESCWERKKMFSRFLWEKDNQEMWAISLYSVFLSLVIKCSYGELIDPYGDESCQLYLLQRHETDEMDWIQLGSYRRDTFSIQSQKTENKQCQCLWARQWLRRTEKMLL